ncbi:MAG: FAD-binding protein [Rhodospirillaceae bacterium]|nr:FAD-binding protein [Rhodospirillaceae bacterium]MBT5240987.1 FAD-binding protein [Rhodospirillaceae bacterium]MBT5564603.1 FAD-binding protein [Rhodospirillaceae bacterium]MBT6090938.1 FAD-binding protein [Rhodospirillaceae bacterium]
MGMDGAARIEDLVTTLQAQYGERCTINHDVRDRHGRGESWHPSAAPDVVVFPHTTEEVSSIVSLCAASGTPIIPFGAGTSLEGQVQALHGGVCIDLSQMNAIVAVNAEDMDCVIQPGVMRADLNAQLRDTGLFFPIDPGAECTIGGMVATRASGTNAVRYGTMRENVLGLTVVMADGSIIKTGGRARKSAAGYDLTRLFVGSEGTLGIVTDITLRLHGIPEATAAAVVAFPSIDAAVETVIEVIQVGVPIARIELMDDVSIDAVNRYSALTLPVAPTLFLEFHGSPASVKEQAETVEALATEHGSASFSWSDKAEDRSELWQARHNAYYAGLALKADSIGLVTDVCVPISRLAECIRETKTDLAQCPMPAPLLGHVGDGNFHVCFIMDKDAPDQVEEAERLHGRMVARALAMGGTCTGEHGIGMGKRTHLVDEAGDGVAVMALIKNALDPANILNPGKIFEVDEPES